MSRLLLARFFELFLKGLYETLAGKVIDGILLVATLIYWLTSGRANEHLWENVLPWVAVCGVIVVWHTIRTGVTLTRQISTARPIQERELSVLQPSGRYATVIIEHTPPAHYRLTIIGISALICGCAIAATGLVWRRGTASAVPVVTRPPSVPDEEAFLVALEYRMLSVPNYGTGYWVLSQRRSGCVFSPVHLALFLRITNLQSHPAMLSSYSVISGHEEMPRLSLRTGRLFWLFPKGRLLTQIPGETVQFPITKADGSMMRASLEDADTAHALPIVRANSLDLLLGDRYLEPSQTVRGWIFVQRPSEGAVVDTAVKLTEITGHSHTYQVLKVNDSPTADILPREMTSDTSVDLSGCALGR